MTSILSSLGLGPTDPATYSDASAVASQQKAAIGGLQATVSSAAAALTAAKAVGVPVTSLGALEKTIADGNALLTQAATMKPADIQKKASEIDAQSMVSQFKILETQYKTTVSSTTAIYKTIQARVDVVAADRTTSADLLKQYRDLLTDVSGSLTLLLSSPPLYTTTTSGSGSSPAYVIPTVPSSTSYQDQLDGLDGQKEIEEGDEPSFTRLFRRFKSWVYIYLYPPLFVLLIIILMILGGVIMSNIYAPLEQTYLPHRIFYFVYGALGFPLSIMYSCVYPPFWVSTLFPAYPRIAPTQEGGASLLSTTAQTLQTALSNKSNNILSSAGLIAATPSVTPRKAATPGKGATTGRPSSSSPTIQFESATNTNLPLTSMDGLFSFVVVDASNPPQYQIDNKKYLWYISLFAASTLMSLTTTYALL
jgi:hypothetical protein